ncbi:hypothetical protein FQR65_LT16430 [Abscondita terminalis]|nr:hypothetical protein FQR65_LT16430 [Abscondita terminalis]
MIVVLLNCLPSLQEKYPDHLVIINAVQDRRKLPADQKIIFGPDRNLGAYVKKKTGRDWSLWNGACMVHEIFSQDKIDALRSEYPDAKFIAHPECEDHILAGADYVGSTSGMLKFTMNDPSASLYVAP